jgi:hypothetical protein
MCSLLVCTVFVDLLLYVRRKFILFHRIKIKSQTRNRSDSTKNKLRTHLLYQALVLENAHNKFTLVVCVKDLERPVDYLCFVHE